MNDIKTFSLYYVAIDLKSFNKEIFRDTVNLFHPVTMKSYTHAHSPLPEIIFELCHVTATCLLAVLWSHKRINFLSLPRLQSTLDAIVTESSQHSKNFLLKESKYLLLKEKKIVLMSPPLQTNCTNRQS